MNSRNWCRKATRARGRAVSSVSRSGSRRGIPPAPRLIIAPGHLAAAEGLSGFEIKNRGFPGYSNGGTKALCSSHVEHGDNRLVFCESAIDALSFPALFPDQHTRYASIGGRPAPVQRALMWAAASVVPASSTVVAAMDADEAGRELTEIVCEAVNLTARSDLRFETIEPGRFKDRNDQLRGRPKIPLPYRP